MIKDLIKEKEKQDEQKLMNAIHQNYKDIRMNRKMDEQLNKIEKQECEKAQKKMMWAIFLAGLCSLIMEIIVLVLEVK